MLTKVLSSWTLASWEREFPGPPPRDPPPFGASLLELEAPLVLLVCCRRKASSNFELFAAALWTRPCFRKVAELQEGRLPALRSLPVSEVL